MGISLSTQAVIELCLSLHIIVILQLAYQESVLTFGHEQVVNEVEMR